MLNVIMLSVVVLPMFSILKPLNKRLIYTFEENSPNLKSDLISNLNFGKQQLFAINENMTL
jgi:hypothetical protein